MNWTTFIKNIASKDGVSDIVIRSNGECYVYSSGVYTTLTTPENLLGDESWYNLMRLLGNPGELKNLKTYEAAVSLGDFRFRISVALHVDGVEAVMRLLPSVIPEPSELGIPDYLAQQFLTLASGLVMVCGATGSGKSTTIASLVNDRAFKKSERYISLEDPIEYLYPNHPSSTFTQREVGVHCDGFAKGLKDALRQKPDVIIVGEIRDRQTAMVALEAAESGHLVVATIHADTADGVVSRYMKLIPDDRVQASLDTMADVLKLSISQKLVKHPESQSLVSLHEIMVHSTGVANNIRNNQLHLLPQLMETGSSEGMQTFDDAKEKRVQDGLLPSSVFRE